jgi:glycosyltransferase 2 family protein
MSMTEHVHADADAAPAEAGTGAASVSQQALAVGLAVDGPPWPCPPAACADLEPGICTDLEPVVAEHRRLWIVAKRTLPVAKRIFAARPVRWAFAATAVGLGGFEVARQWSRVGPVLSNIGPWSAAGAMLSVLIAMFASMQVWRLLLAALGSPLSVSPVTRIVFVGQLGKYVPGSVWPVLAQMELSSVYGVPRHRSATASVLSPLITISCGLLAAVLTLPFVVGSGAYLWTLAAAPLLLACLCPKVLNSGMTRLLRLTRRPPLEQPLALRTIAACAAWSIGSWACYGMQIWLLADRLGAHGSAAGLRAIGGFALAWSAGFLAVFVPAGAGVREVLLVAVLAPVTGADGAIAMALASRMLTTAGDLLAAFAAAGYAWRWSARCRRRSEAT